MIRTTQNMEFFDKKSFTMLTILTIVYATFEIGFCNWNTKMVQNKELKDFHLAFIQKLRLSDMRNQIQSCIKHGRSHMSFLGHCLSTLNCPEAWSVIHYY